MTVAVNGYVTCKTFNNGGVSGEKRNKFIKTLRSR